MPQKIKAALCVAATILGFASAATAQSATSTAYSARAVHEVPGQPETFGLVYKSGQNMRLEFDQNGKSVVQILLPAAGAMYILDPETKSYFEVLGPAVTDEAAEGYVSPCQTPRPGVQCQRVGTDKISGITVEHWVIATSQQSRPTYIWWDSARRRALRQDHPDGSSSVMAFKAMEDVNGRQAEHWTITVTAPGQQALTGGWWFDPELRVAVREQLPNGETRNLQDVRVGAIDPALFAVPEGWTKQTQQPQQPAPAASQ